MSAIWVEGNLQACASGLRFNGQTVAPPDFDFDTIFVDPVQGGYVSYQALRMLGRWGTTVVITDRMGWPQSAFYPMGRNDAPLRLAQMKAALDPQRRLVVARAFVESKFENLPPTSRIETLRSWEGQAEFERWQILGVNRRSAYTRRLNRKATRPECAALNYAQAVHAAIVGKIVRRVGLDPSVAFLHQSWKDKDAFVYDAQELARHRIDKVALSFTPETVRQEDWTVRLTKESGKELARQVCESFRLIEGRIGDDLRALGAWFFSPRGAPHLRSVPL